MRIHRREVSNICLMQIEGEVVAEHANQLKQNIAAAFAERSSHFVLDLRNVSFIDSTGLGVLISLLRRLNEASGRLKLVGLQEEVKAVFQITRLLRVFDVASSVELALREIQGRA